EWQHDQKKAIKIKKHGRLSMSLFRYGLDYVQMAIQLHGGAGVSRDTPLTGFFAQARSLRLADGPDEVHKGMIAKLELAKRGYGRHKKV
ncbi:acyl-CoA dehydrogenase, C-terminal domain protein, partial [Acinetobacter baumannii 1032359]|uniref:acyl-CoA dehydrogenase family protein n=1 Tax=Acinetobacter baumannii TaxID=470 RepID=UPI00049F3960